MRYVAIVNGWEFTVSVDQPGSICIGDTTHSVDLEGIDGDALFCLFVDGEPHELFAERRANGYHITIDGIGYDVQVEHGRMPPRQLRWPGKGRREPGREAGAATVTSPMPGIVIDVLVEVGQAVQTGDRLAILEAMKMENEIRAPYSGVVTSIQVVRGQTVNLNDIVVTIGAPPNAEHSAEEA
ncbi:MAG: biotin/lipoyl-binding protein [Anaerolineae bacterium]